MRRLEQQEIPKTRMKTEAGSLVGIASVDEYCVVSLAEQEHDMSFKQIINMIGNWKLKIS